MSAFGTMQRQQITKLEMNDRRVKRQKVTTSEPGSACVSQTVQVNLFGMITGSFQ
ncbi:hypothetical protein [Shimia sp.]|uniref:hypothetical protein n=1 Tax=Shimia sp. TaxID=1954381 RepID=UPI00329A5C9A